MKELRGNGYKKISLTAKNAIPEDLFSIPGTANLEWDKSKTSVSFMFSGTVMTIMNQLHRLELEDILIEEPSLEEIFLHYYE
jgi:ABC-2 type transport system ATP-binding protein